MLIHLQMTSDARVVSRVLGGRRDDFSVLVDRYYRPVLSVVRARLDNPADAEDVAQETFVSAYQKLDTLHTPDRFGPWLMSIARNTAYSWARRRRIEVLMPNVTDIAEHAVEPGVEREELCRIVQRKLSEMEPEQREILMLFYFGGKSIGEVASLLDTSRAAASKRLQRARAALGTEFLKSIGEAEKPEDVKKARKNVMAAVAAAPVAWKAEAAAAGWASLVLVKVLLGLLTVAAVGTGAVVAYKYVASQQADPVVVQTSAPEPAAPKVAELPAEAAETAPAAQDPDLPTGPGNILCQLVTEDSHEVVPNAEVTAELITWGPREMPPAKTLKWRTRTDSEGKFVFKNVPLGVYCLLGLTPTHFGVNDHTATVEVEDPNGRIWPIWMYPRISINGKLTGPGGGPVAGAVIYPVKHAMFSEEEFSHTQIASARVTTGSDGSFTFPSILPGAFKFYIVSANFPPTITDYKRIEGELSIKLETPGTIAGRVVDKDNQPKAGITVRAFQGSEIDVSAPSASEDTTWKGGHRVALDAVSGPDGAFRIANVFPGKYMIETDNSVLLNTSPDVELEVKPGAETSADIHVDQGGTILGRIFNKDNSEGIEGVSVMAQSTGQRGTSDGNGEYMLTGLKPGSHDLYLFVGTGKERDQLMESNRSVSVGYGEVVEGIDFPLAAPAKVTGRVVDRYGVAVAGAKVTIGWQRTTTTDANGCFVFSNVVTPTLSREGLPPSVSNMMLSAQKDRWQSEKVSPDFKVENVLTLNVSAGAVIFGKVLSAQGKPLGYHSVYATPDVSAAYSTNSAETDPAGEFKLENLREGAYTLSASPRNGGIGPVASTTVTVAPNQVLRNVVLQPQLQGALSISGRLTTFDGGPIYGGKVSIQNLSTNVDADGRFSLTGLAEGEYNLTATAITYTPVLLNQVAAGTSNLDLTLGPLASLAGTVTDASTGQPVTVFEVQCSASIYDYMENVPTSMTQSVRSETGSFAVKEFVAMPTQLTIISPGYAPYNEQVTLKGGANELAIQLQLEAIVTGVVTDSSGAPLAGASVQPLDGVPYLYRDRAVITGQDGCFTISQLAAGQPVKLGVMCAGYAPECVEITPQREAQNAVAVVLKPAGSVQVQAFRDGVPAEGFYISSIMDCVGGSYFSPTKGLAVNLPEGEVELKVYLPQNDQPGLEQKVKANVVAGQTTAVEVHFNSQPDEAAK